MIMRRHMIQTLQRITLYCPMKALVSQPAMAVVIQNGISQNWYAEQWTPVNAMTCHWVYIAECWNQYCSFWFNSSYSIVSYVAARLIFAADSMVAYSMSWKRKWIQRLIVLHHFVTEQVAGCSVKNCFMLVFCNYALVLVVLDSRYV